MRVGVFRFIKVNVRLWFGVTHDWLKLELSEGQQINEEGDNTSNKPTWSATA